jgi:hypothetical protein
VPEYDPKPWNDGGDVQSSSNCYDYAVDTKKTGRKLHDPTSQPGRKAGKAIGKIPYKCSAVKQGVKDDGGDKVKESTKDAKCADTCWKVAVLVLGELDEANDYHFVRQDSDNKWSNKVDGSEVTRNDSNGNEIKDPESADFWTVRIGDTEKLRYKLCGYFCFCPGIQLASLAPPKGETFVAFSVKEKATLSTSTFELSVPPGDYTLLRKNPTEDLTSVIVEARVFSGESNPRWVLNPEETQTLRAKIAGLPPTEQRPANPTGNRGFVIDNLASEASPGRISVLDGTLAIHQAGKQTRWFADIHQVESWLTTGFNRSPVGQHLARIMDGTLTTG